MHPRPTRSRITPQGHGLGGEAERRLHFRHGPPPPQGKGDAVSRVWALSRQVLPTGRRLAGGSRGLGPWPDPPPPRPARHSCRSRPREDTQSPASVKPKRRRPPRLSGGGRGGPKAKEAPQPQRRGPRWAQSEGGPLASAAGASVVPKLRRPPRLSARASVVPKRRRPPRLSGGDLGAPKRRRPPRLSGGCLGGPKAMEAPSPQRGGPRWSQSGGGPLVAAEGASVIRKRKRPPRLSGGCLGGPKSEEAPSPRRRGPRWSQSRGGPLASAEGASVIPKRRRPPCLSGGGLGDPKAEEAPSP